MTHRPLDALAATLASKAQNAGYITVLVDVTGRVHTLPAAAEIVAVYGPGARKADVLDDLRFVEARG